MEIVGLQIFFSHEVRDEVIPKGTSQAVHGE
jgi:hypothetical protein